MYLHLLQSAAGGYLQLLAAGGRREWSGERQENRRSVSVVEGSEKRWWKEELRAILPLHASIYKASGTEPYTHRVSVVLGVVALEGVVKSLVY